MVKKRSNFSNTSHKTIYLVAAIIILVAIGIMVNAAVGSISTPNPGHNSTQVFIPIGNSYITLQNAIDYGYLLGVNITPVPTSPLPASTPYELANKIIITLGGYNVTLQDALDHGLIANPSNSQNYAKSSIPAGGEYASRININTSRASPNNIMTLQSAIAADINLLKNLMTYQWKSESWSGNGVCPTTTWTRTVYCQRSDGTQVPDGNCIGTKPATSTTTACTWVNQGSPLGCAPGDSYVQRGIPYKNLPGCGAMIGAGCLAAGSTTYCDDGSCSCGYGCGGLTVNSLACTVHSP